MKTKIRLAKSSRAVVAVQPAQPTSPKTVVTTVPSIVQPATSLVPPLERALTQFAEELRKELTLARGEVQTLQATVAALQSELAALRSRYETHTHGYTRTLTGSGGTQWFTLGHLKNYLDEDKGNFDSWGAYFREGGVTGSAPEIRTGTPSP